MNIFCEDAPRYYLRSGYLDAYMAFKRSVEAL